MVMGVSPRMDWIGGAAGVGVWASVSPGNLSRLPTLTCIHASSPVLPSFLHVPVPLCLPGLRSLEDKSGIGIRTILPGPILFSQELQKLG